MRYWHCQTVKPAWRWLNDKQETNTMTTVQEHLKTAQISTNPEYESRTETFLTTVEKVSGPDLDAIAAVDPEDIGSAFVSLPAAVAYWSVVAAGAQQALNKAERDMKHKEAVLYLETRHALEFDPKVAKVTEALIEATMRADTRWVEMQSELEAAQVAQAHARVRMDVLRVKREALASFGALRRAEMAANVYAGA